MTLRTLILATSAFVVSVGFAASAADAATAQPRRHRAMAHHTTGKPAAMRHGAMGGRMSRGGGDAQNSTVDQLNAQSLAAARGGAAPAGAAMAPAAAPQ